MNLISISVLPKKKAHIFVISRRQDQQGIPSAESFSVGSFWDREGFATFQCSQRSRDSARSILIAEDTLLLRSRCTFLRL